MNKIEVIQNLIDELNYQTYLYDKGEERISDEDWDDLYFQLVELEKETGIIYPNSPTQKINYDVVNELQKVEHNHPLLSLDKTKDVNDLESFVGDKAYTVMGKMDGLTISVRYENGVLMSAETRGNGTIGEDVLHNAKTIKNLPKTISYKEELIIDGEAIITYSDFEQFKDDYANPRNLVSGSIRLLDATEAATRQISFVAWKVFKGFEDVEYYSQKLDLLDELGFSTVPRLTDREYRLADGYISIEDMIDQIRTNCEILYYPIDGCVVGIDNIEEAKAMGEATSHHEKFQLAYKFYDEECESTLRDIEWSMGRTGQLTPVAIFDDIDFGDSVVNRASLHNLSIMEQLYPHNWHSGLKIKVFKANAIIPQISKVWFDKASCVQRVDCPFCPVCGEPTTVVEENDSKILYCLNPECSGKLNKRIEHFCSKKGMDIKGLSKKTIEKLIDWEWLNSISDLYELSSHRKDWINKAGFGVASTDKILKAIEESKNFALDKFICGLGIPEIGSTAAKDLKNKFQTWENFRNATKDELLELPNFGDIMVNYILTFDYTEADEIVNKYMQTNTVDIALNDFTEEVNSNIQKELTLIGKVFTITGKLSKKRDDIITDIEAAGGKVTGSVSKKTNYLVNNDAQSTSAKNKKAKELNIPIISEEELYKMIGE